jgi:hypothetical protein
MEYGWMVFVDDQPLQTLGTDHWRGSYCTLGYIYCLNLFLYLQIMVLHFLRVHRLLQFASTTGRCQFHLFSLKPNRNRRQNHVSVFQTENQHILKLLFSRNSVSWTRIGTWEPANEERRKVVVCSRWSCKNRRLTNSFLFVCLLLYNGEIEN